MARSEQIKIDEKIKDQIKEDFSFVKDNPKILGIMLYGSTIYGKDHQKSDIDICVVTTYKKIGRASCRERVCHRV